MLGLTAAGCTNTMSLGAAGPPDGGDAIVITSNDASDAPADLPADVTPDLATDAQVDQNNDGPPVTCVDKGVTYHVGDVIPNGSAACPNSCFCLAGGVVGHCTGVCRDGSADDGGGGQSCVDNGITYHSGDVVLRPGCQQSCICTDGVVGNCTGIPCPVDASVVIDPIPVATITRGGPISPGIEVIIDTLGRAQRTVNNTSGALPPPRTFSPGAPEVTRFLYHAQRVGDLTGLTLACPDAGTNVIIVHLLSGSGVTSSNFDCPLLNPTPDSLALVQDINALLGINESNMPSNDSINAQTCTATGGSVANSLCCTGAANFPDSCAIGACSCGPTNVQVVDTCVCPNGGCFQKSVGCVGPANACTVGDDQTCNDNIALNAFHGHCLAGGHCTCITGSTVLASGKCS